MKDLKCITDKKTRKQCYDQLEAIFSTSTQKIKVNQYSSKWNGISFINNPKITFYCSLQCDPEKNEYLFKFNHTPPPKNNKYLFSMRFTIDTSKNTDKEVSLMHDSNTNIHFVKHVSHFQNTKFHSAKLTNEGKEYIQKNHPLYEDDSDVIDFGIISDKEVLVNNIANFIQYYSEVVYKKYPANGQKTINSCTSQETIQNNLKNDTIVKTITTEPPINIANFTQETTLPKEVITRCYIRDISLSDRIKAVASGHCMLCKKQAPFIDKNGNPFLESHHIIPLSEKGEDKLENLIALCPNCHRKLHHADKPSATNEELKAITAAHIQVIH